MGYSCTKDAGDMLGFIRHQFSDGKTSNGLVIRQHGDVRLYFYEVGKEQADGAVTGTLFQSIDETHARKVGSFRINANGTIARFPRIRRDMQVSMYFRFLELQRTNPALLSSYSHGGI